MDLSITRTPVLFQKVLEANKRLQQRYNIQTSVHKDIAPKEKVYLSNGVLVFPNSLRGESFAIYNMRGQMIQSGEIGSIPVISKVSKQPLVVVVNGESHRLL